MKEIKALFQTLLFATLMIFIFSACNKNSIKHCTQHAVAACTVDTTKTNIRITNISKYDLCNVVLDPASGPVNCGIGEVPLGVGKFTYIIDVIDYDNGKMTIDVIPD